MREQGERLLAFGAGAVLMKGGHGGGVESVDLLIERTATNRLVAQRIATRNTHGTGCTLASAVAAEEGPVAAPQARCRDSPRRTRFSTVQGRSAARGSRDRI